MIIMWSKNYWPMSLSEFTYIWFALWKFFWIWQFYVPKGRYEYFVAMVFNVMRTCNFVLPLSHYHLASSMLMKTRHLVILLSHYLAISYHLELPPADGLSLFHSTFTCEHCTREYVSKEKLWMVAPCFCRLSLLSCPFLLHPTRKSILSQNALMATPDILGIKSGTSKMQRNLHKTKVPV